MRTSDIITVLESRDLYVDDLKSIDATPFCCLRMVQGDKTSGCHQIASLVNLEMTRDKNMLE